jgi:hypothetical protein
MTETKQSKAVANVKKQGQGQQQDKLTQKTADKRDLLEVPILRFGQSTNNFIQFREALSTAALIKVGDVVKLIQLGKYYEIAPVEPDYKIPGNEWPVMNGKENNKMKAKQAGLYGFIWRYMSLESCNIMKEAAYFNT